MGAKRAGRRRTSRSGHGSARIRAEAKGITIHGGFDHSFIVAGEGLREHCRLTAPEGLSLATEVTTTQWLVRVV